MRRALLACLLLPLTSCTYAAAWQPEKIVTGNMLYTVATVDLQKQKLALYWQNPAGKPYRNFESLRAYLQKQAKRPLFMTNSGIYAPGLKPLGLHTEGGKTLVGLNNARSSGNGGGNFALLPNGVFWVRGMQAGVTETQAYQKQDLQPDYATQSGPLLVSGGRLHPAFNKSSTSFKVRSGVGVCAGGKVRFAISAGPVNFYTFATFFRDTLKCPDALYLDGSISAYATADTNTQLADFAGIWVVTEK